MRSRARRSAGCGSRFSRSAGCATLVPPCTLSVLMRQARARIETFMAELTHTDVDAILRILDQMQGREIHLEIGELKLHVTAAGERAAERSASVPSPPAAVRPAAQAAAGSDAPAAPAAIPPGQVAVCAPTMGTFFRAESPGAKPYAEVGDRVKAADVVAIFEVMKLFSTLTAGVDGTVKAFLVANETLVAQDQPLILIQPD